MKTMWQKIIINKKKFLVSVIQKIKKVVKKNPKQVSLISFGVLAVIFILIGAVSFWQNKNRAEPSTLASNDVVERYRENLPELEKKAKSNNPDDLKNYAVAQYVTGDVDGSEETYKKIMEKGEDSAVVHNNLGNILRDKKNYEKAINEYKKAIEKDKNFLNAYYNLGSVYQYSLNDPKTAIEIYEKGIKDNPDIVDLQIYLGQAYEQLKDLEKAKVAYEKALQIDPDNAAAKTGLARINKPDESKKESENK